MKRTIRFAIPTMLLVAALLFASTAVATAQAGSSTFPDVSETHPAHDAIESLAARGIISGTDAGLFMPDDFLTRGQAATLSRLFPTVCAIAEPQVLKGRRFGNVVLVASEQAEELGWLPRLLASGPHPARMLAGREFEEFVRGARPVTDADAVDSPRPARELFDRG